MRAPPDDCPRLVDGGIGPRVCPHRGCPLHTLHNDPGPGRPVSARRLRVLVELGNDCVLDVVAQHPDGMSTELAGLYLGTSRQGAQLLTRRIERKVRKGNRKAALEIEFLRWRRRVRRPRRR